MINDRTDRARGALVGLAIGNALGTPVRGLSRALIHEVYGWPLAGFESPSHDHEPEAGGMVAGQVGPGVDEALGLADHLLAREGSIDPGELRTELQLPVLPADAPLINNRAAIRCVPIGVSRAQGDLERIVADVAAACQPSHDSQVAIAGAAAVAAAIARAIEDGDLSAAIAAAVRAARASVPYGRYTAAPSLAQRLDWALACVDPANADSAIALVCDLIGTSRASQESIPAAFAVLAVLGPDADPWFAARWAASLGGSADAIAGIVGAISGAVHGAGAINADAVNALESANPDLDLERRAKALADLTPHAGT